MSIFPMEPICPKCGYLMTTIKQERTVFGRWNVTRQCKNCNRFTINRVVVQSPAEDLEDWYNAGYKIISDTWNRLPRFVQSSLIIGLWIFIIGSSIYQTITNPLEYKTIPLAVCAVLFSMLGGFYIVMELKGELRKK